MRVNGPIKMELKRLGLACFVGLVLFTAFVGTASAKAWDTDEGIGEIVNDILVQSNIFISSLFPDLEDIPAAASFNKTRNVASVGISTDKTEYAAGETMLINITLANPTEEWQHVYFALRLDLPEYDYQHWIMVKPLYLPSGFEKTVTIPFVLGDYGFPFNASWYVTLYDITTLEVISEDFAEWKYMIPPPTISDVDAVDLHLGATIQWETDVPATSQVEYGKTPEYGFNTSLDEELVFHHNVRIDGLEPETIYFFRIKSRNAAGVEAVSKGYTFAIERSEEITINFTGSTYKNVTEKPTGWFETGQDADIVLGLNDFGKATPTIFNHPMKIATDAERLILADTWNNRVLIWNSTPTEINQPPDLVIGQNDLNYSEPGLAADKLNWPVGVATDGQHLLVADTENDRVLIWNEFPTENGEPADLVLGAPNFTSCYDGPLPSGTEQKEVFLWPWDVFTDGTRVIVTSTAGGRVLIWNEFPTQNFQPADVVLTQEVELQTPRCAYFDGQHLLVGDYNAKKTFVWNELPQSDDEPYDFTLGESPYTHEEFAWAISTVNGKLLTLMYHRVFIWNDFPTDETDVPDIMLGHVDFGGSPVRPTAASFEASHGGMAATTDHLFISCFNQNRVLIYSAIPTSNITFADVVLGAPDFETNTLLENYVIQNPAVCSDGEHLFVGSGFDLTLSIWKSLPNESLAKPDIVYNGIAPLGVATYGNKLVAVDAARKVLIWNELPLNGEMPDIELGPEFDNETELMLPSCGGVAADENYLFVSDSQQNKIFVWEEGIPNTTKASDFAIDVLQPYQLSSDGEHLAAASLERQAILIWNLPLDKGNLTPDAVIGGLLGAVRFNLPQGVFIDGEHLFVGDTCFNRVLIWNEIPTSNETPPDIVLGQKDFEDTFPHTTRDGLFWPGILSFDGSYLWVGEFKFSNRLVRFPVRVKEGEEIPWPMFHRNAQHTGQSTFNGPQTNTLKWKYTHENITEGSWPNSFCVDKDGTVYVAAADKLLALSSDGELLWSADLAGTGATAISPDGTTIYAVGGTNLYAFTTSGEALWTYEEPTENIFGEPCVASDGTIYCGSWDTYVYALNPDGTLKWKYQTDGAIAPLASPTLSNDEATIYVGSGDPNKDDGGTLYAINADGTLQWKRENLDQMRVSGAVVGPNGRIYVTGSGRVHCFSPDGTKVWQSEEDTAGSLTASLSSDGTLYVGNPRDGKVYAIDASNGETKWSYQTGGAYGVPCTPVIGADGTVYVGAGVMYALNPDGSVLWTYQTGDGINEHCPAIGPDGTLYFSSADKYIYAIKDN